MTKKKIIGLFLFVIIMIVIYGMGYLFGQSLCNDNDFNYKEDTIINNPVVNVDDEYNEVAKTEEIVVLPDTKLYVEEYNVSDKTISLIEMNVPVEFVGMTRDELLKKIDELEKYIKKDDQNIESIMLMDLNKNQMVIRKSFLEVEKEEETSEEKDKIAYKYFIVLINDVITVYDKSTGKVFVETVIPIDMLDEESKKQLTTGILVRNISEMYRILESFTS